MNFSFKLPVAALLFAVAALSQEKTPDKPLDPEEKERQELSNSLGEAGTSPIDFLRALERHLEKYPNSKQRPQIERAAVKAAIEAKDNRKIIQYGERVLAVPRQPGQEEDVDVLDRVVRALLATDDPQTAKRALLLSARYVNDCELMRKQAPTRYSAAQWAEQVDRATARALSLMARAQGNFGSMDDAAKTARKSWDTYPTSEGARETGRWLARTGKPAEAVEFYADAFMIEDPQSSEIDRGRDRIHMGELFSKVNGSEKGLGDVILQAYDRASALMNERLSRLKQKDPNASATSILDFTLPSNEGPALQLTSLKGKTVILEFWATWCGPCRIQHPMIEEVKKKFATDPNVVFLYVNADDDRTVVAPFLKDMGWKNNTYFESGLSAMLRISSIPTVIIVDPAGQISSRMVGFIPERFLDMLAARIHEASRGPAATVLP